MHKISRLTLGLAIALGASAYGQAQTQRPAHPGDPMPTYRATVVSRTTHAVNYRHRSGATKIDFQGTDLMPGASGEAKVESKRGALEIEVEFAGLDRPTTFGNEYLTYVLWAISPEGRSVNIGEVLVGDNHRSKLDVTTDLQAFAMIVTAEPYYAVRRPSNVVIAENVIRQDTKGTSEAMDAKYELIDRGGYIPTGYNFDPIVLNAKLPLEFFEARNAVRIAKSAGAERYASSSYENAIRQMNEADAMATGRHENKKSLIAVSRETVQTAEDSREIATKRIADDRAENERNASAGREANANAATADAIRDRDDADRKKNEAEANTEGAVRDRNDADRQKHEAEEAARRAQGAQANAEADSDRDRAAAAASEQQVQDAKSAQASAEADSDRNRAAAASSDLRAQDAERDREELRAKLLQQFNLILETRDTARGLVVNMSDVLFDSGKYTLRPLAREKLAKISGIVLAYPSLRLAVEGNTDSVGTEEFNQTLSENRAESVRTYLTGQGIPESSTTAQGFGKTRPIASNDTSDGRQQNRRVELVVSGEVIGTKIVSLMVLPVTASSTPR
ncbi:MAG TPA: OmpA family protein [Candidatus Acidoferrum sp.]|nr:OmpA family protein [Candidatus Acidoferrum sp.]